MVEGRWMVRSGVLSLGVVVLHTAQRNVALERVSNSITPLACLSDLEITAYLH